MNKLGQLYEQLAAEYLQQQGLTLLQQNYQCKAGEIDLVMRDGASLVFVERQQRLWWCPGGSHRCQAAEITAQQPLVFTATPVA